MAVMFEDPDRYARRTFLRGTTAALGVGTLGTAAAAGQSGDKLRLFAEQEVPGALEAVTQGRYAYVATGDGMTVVDWSTPGRPERVGRVDATDPASGVLDVKVDGDVASMAHNGGPGVTLVDVADPNDPREAALYDTGAHVHNNFVADDLVYVGVNESGDSPFSRDRVEILDASDPDDPEKVGEWRLADGYPGYASGWVSPLHDLYVQGDRAYLAHWDAGTVALDVSDPADPEAVARFGGDPRADEPPEDDEFPLERYLTKPGNAHYVQPSPDGDHVYVGAETFPQVFDEDPDTDQYGGIAVWNVTDLSSPEQVAYVSPPEEGGFRTAHNFDLTRNRLHASWYRGGARVYDVTDPTSPTEEAVYRPDDAFYWTAVAERGFTVASRIGGGLVFLSRDNGKKQPPAFDGDDEPPEDPGIEAERRA